MTAAHDYTAPHDGPLVRPVILRVERGASWSHPAFESRAFHDTQGRLVAMYMQEALLRTKGA
jgi:hypothetical protein